MIFVVCSIFSDNLTTTIVFSKVNWCVGTFRILAVHNVHIQVMFQISVVQFAATVCLRVEKSLMVDALGILMTTAKSVHAQ